MNEGHGEGGWFKTLLICGGLLVGKKQKTPNNKLLLNTYIIWGKYNVIESNPMSQPLQKRSFHDHLGLVGWLHIIPHRCSHHRGVFQEKLESPRHQGDYY